MRNLSEANNVQPGRSIRSLISELESNGLISKETAKVTLDLAALRNKVAHANEEAITYETSAAFANSAKRVIAAIKTTNA